MLREGGVWSKGVMEAANTYEASLVEDERVVEGVAHVHPPADISLDTEDTCALFEEAMK